MFNQPRTGRSSWSLDANHTNQTWTNVRCWARRQKIRFVLLDFVARASKQAPSAIFKKCAVAVTWYQRTTLLLSYYPKQPWQDGRALHGLVSSQEACFFFESFQLVYLHVKFLPLAWPKPSFFQWLWEDTAGTRTLWSRHAPYGTEMLQQIGQAQQIQHGHLGWSSEVNVDFHGRGYVIKLQRPAGRQLLGRQSQKNWLSFHGVVDVKVLHHFCFESGWPRLCPERSLPEASPASWRYHPHQDIRWVMGWSQHFRSTEDTPMFSTPVLWTTIPWKRKLNPYLTYLFGVRCQKARGVSPLGFHQPKDSRSCTSQGPPDSSPHEFCTAAGIVT